MSARIKKGDSVKVITGSDKGKSGKVLAVSAAGRVVVEGVRILKKHAKRTQANPDGGILQREGAIHISNVALVAGAGSK